MHIKCRFEKIKSLGKNSITRVYKPDAKVISTSRRQGRMQIHPRTQRHMYISAVYICTSSYITAPTHIRYTVLCRGGDPLNDETQCRLVNYSLWLPSISFVALRSSNLDRRAYVWRSYLYGQVNAQLLSEWLGISLIFHVDDAARVARGHSLARARAISRGVFMLVCRQRQMESIVSVGTC